MTGQEFFTPQAADRSTDTDTTWSSPSANESFLQLYLW
ncbi:hypothetical protein HMPREF9303_0382 [Prevotella denticola CRIS 18C-A]|uniref:Uncharacterized protein n=1 Tax=Prevotella denticola CRIS 18C-A TaxID=944557 RepID=F0HAC4_9BACT|nr:hypothetical protein HMPREF9303_0382 [Prevotella denticola CRIS 18C-A]